jgi:hypothetical protein
MEKPRCVAAGIGVSPCLRSVYNWTVYGNGPLHGEWEGWRIAGRDLIAPGGVRISRGELEAFMRTTVKRKAGTVVRLTPAAAACTRPVASPLAAPSNDGGPVGGAGALRAATLRGTWLQE